MNNADHLKLADCPFCGQAGELTDTMPGGTYWVRCSTCDAEGPSSDARTAEQAIELWNRRASSERTQETQNG